MTLIMSRKIAWRYCLFGVFPMILGFLLTATGMLSGRFIIKSVGLVLFLLGIIINGVYTAVLPRRKKKAIRAVCAQSKWEDFIQGAAKYLEQQAFQRNDCQIPMTGKRWAAVRCFWHCENPKKPATIVVLIEGADDYDDVMEVFPSLCSLLEKLDTERLAGQSRNRRLFCFVQEELSDSLKELCTSSRYAYANRSLLMAGVEKKSNTIYYQTGETYVPEGIEEMAKLLQQGMILPETVKLYKNNHNMEKEPLKK